jgi:hypothetical protein
MRTGLRSRVVLAVAAAGVLAAAAVSASAQPVALVTDVAGRVTGPAPLAILSEISSDTRVQLDPGARLVALYLKSGDEYTFSGPAHVHFGAEAPQTTKGAKPRKKISPLGRGGNVNIRPVNVTQAAFVMRGGRSTARIRLLSLSGTRTLETAPEFRWREIEPGARYRFEITDDTGKSLYETESTETVVRLPASATLREGASYTWEVSARAADGRRYVSAGDFSIATAALRAEAESLRPAAGAPVSERVAYAAWLEQAELRDEARQYWRALSEERPGDAKLKALAGDGGT